MRSLLFFSNSIYYTDDTVQETQTIPFCVLHVNGMITNGSTKIMSTYIAKCFLFGHVLLLLKIKINCFSQWKAAIRYCESKGTTAIKPMKMPISTSYVQVKSIKNYFLAKDLFSLQQHRCRSLNWG